MIGSGDLLIDVSNFVFIMVLLMRALYMQIDFETTILHSPQFTSTLKQWWFPIPYHPCMVYLPGFTIKNQPNVGKYATHEWHGNWNLLTNQLEWLKVCNSDGTLRSDAWHFGLATVLVSVQLWVLIQTRHLIISPNWKVQANAENRKSKTS